MDPSCKKLVPIWGTKSVPEIGAKSGAKVHKLVPFSGTDLVPENGTKNGAKTGTRMHFVYVFIHCGQFCRPLPVGSHEPLFWFQKNGTILWSGGIDFGSKKRNRFGPRNWNQNCNKETRSLDQKGHGFRTAWVLGLGPLRITFVPTILSTSGADLAPKKQPHMASSC